MGTTTSGDSPTIPSPPDCSGPDQPERIGPYRILETLGEGAMGTVCLAEQTAPVHRRVALKLVKWGMDTREVIARFESERQARDRMSSAKPAKTRPNPANIRSNPRIAAHRRQS